MNQLRLFTTTSNKVIEKFVAPATVAGLQASITPTGFPALKYERSFGKGTFASFSTVSNEPTDVGIRLGNDRIRANAGMETFLSLGPPFEVGQASVGSLWKTATESISTNLETGKTATVIYSAARNNAPAALTGHTIKTTVTGKTTTHSVITFSYQNFTDTGGDAGSGTYTYAPYTPTMALLQLARSGVAAASADEYVLLNFTSPVAGAFVGAKPDASAPGGWAFSKGSFTLQVTP